MTTTKSKRKRYRTAATMLLNGHHALEAKAVVLEQDHRYSPAMRSLRLHETKWSKELDLEQLLLWFRRQDPVDVTIMLGSGDPFDIAGCLVTELMFGSKLGITLTGKVWTVVA